MESEVVEESARRANLSHKQLSNEWLRNTPWAHTSFWHCLFKSLTTCCLANIEAKGLSFPTSVHGVHLRHVQEEGLVPTHITLVTPLQISAG